MTLKHQALPGSARRALLGPSEEAPALTILLLAALVRLEDCPRCACERQQAPHMAAEARVVAPASPTSPAAVVANIPAAAACICC